MTTGVHPEQCNNLKVNGFAVFKGRPCKIMEMSKSKPGKHGAAKYHLVGIDIFSGKKYDEICQSTHQMEVPDVNKFDMQLIDVSDDQFLSLMSEDGKDTRGDLKVPAGEVGERLTQLFGEDKNVIVTIQSSMGEEMVVAVKESK